MQIRQSGVQISSIKFATEIENLWRRKQKRERKIMTEDEGKLGRFGTKVVPPERFLIDKPPFTTRISR